MGLYDLNMYTYRLGPAVNQIGKVTLGSVLGPPIQGLFHGSPVVERLKCHSGQLSKSQAERTDPRAFSTSQRTKYENEQNLTAVRQRP